MSYVDKYSDVGGIVHEFDGPVKIVLVNAPPDENSWKKSMAAFIEVSTIMIGANVAIVLLFVLGFKLPMYLNAHIMLCTFGYQFCMPLAILMMNPLHGPSAPLRKPQRINEHMCLHIFGMLVGIIGTVMAMNGEKSILEPDVDPTTTFHFFFGILTAFFTVINAILGLAAYCGGADGSCLLKTCHRFTGMLTYIFSTICFIFGIVKPSMQLWLFIIGYMAPTYLITFFAVFYTLIILVDPAARLIDKIIELYNC